MKMSGPRETRRAFGVAQHEITDGEKILGHVDEEDVLLVRRRRVPNLRDESTQNSNQNRQMLKLIKGRFQ